jgi:hypothetical protein
MTNSVPVLQIRHSEGHDWLVAATWPDGRYEEIAGFKNESEANEWIANKFQAWLDNQSDVPGRQVGQQGGQKNEDG